jgi:hypothetical protein
MNRLAYHSLLRFNRRVSACVVSAALFSLMNNGATLLAQTPPASSQTSSTSESVPDSADSDARRIADVERRLNEVTTTLTQTQHVLAKSLLEIQQLRSQLGALRAQTAQPSGGMEIKAAQDSPANTSQSVVGNDASPKSDLKSLHDEQDALQAEIKQHEQIKVETVSKYPLRVTGLVLFNAFANAGVVDDAKLPTLALPRNPGSSHGSVGATLSQTLLALEATGPRLGSARSSAEVSIDFFGGASSNVYGYNSTAGLVRMRQSQMSLDWDKTTVQASFMEPLISPLSPTSYATVAQPALAGSGNLWTWSPQLRVEQRVPISGRQRIAFEAGLIDPPSPGYTSIQLDSPVEASRRPGYEGRVSYHVDGTGAIASPFVFGVGVYSSRQFYNSTTRVHSWAVTGDWQVPLSKWFELTGEIYRGRALGGLGGGAYKDTLTGTDVITGLTRTIGVDAVGGWSQLKVRLNSTFETNAMFGLDNALSRNFDGLILSSSSYPLQLYARSTTVVGNVIFRPKTYLILSPEYRRILSWRYTGPANIANVFTLTAGYQF